MYVSIQNEGQVYVSPKEKRQCGYCGLSSRHRNDGGCNLMSEPGYLLKKGEGNNFHIKFTHHDHDIW